jgi:hypothetical protein
MLHPHTELRFVSDKIGYGIFATKFIPIGTLTWVKDKLDRVFTPDEVAQMDPANLENLLKYTYRDRAGNYFFCWDLTRFVNHSYKPNSMLTSMGYEVAICDINAGEEITNDYGSFNIIEPFECAWGPHERQFVRPDDLTRYYQEWDNQIAEAMKNSGKIEQPLSLLLSLDQKNKLKDFSEGRIKIPSVLENYYST